MTHEAVPAFHLSKRDLLFQALILQASLYP